jgi:hypothetical protein
VQNADIGISHHSMDNQAPKKKHLMKRGIYKQDRGDFIVKSLFKACPDEARRLK